jgi:hypothetical protein
MGGGEPKLPPVCSIKREVFQNRLLDVYAAYNLMKYYQDLMQHANINENGRPPKTLQSVKNFDDDTTQRIRKRAVDAGMEGPDFELYTYINTFAATYNQVEGDRARVQLLYDVIARCYDVLLAFSSNLYNMCEGTGGFDRSFNVDEEYTPLPPPRQVEDKEQ